MSINTSSIMLLKRATQKMYIFIMNEALNKHTSFCE